MHHPSSVRCLAALALLSLASCAGAALVARGTGDGWSRSAWSDDLPGRRLLESSAPRAWIGLSTPALAVTTPPGVLAPSPQPQAGNLVASPRQRIGPLAHPGILEGDVSRGPAPSKFHSLSSLPPGYSGEMALRAAFVAAGPGLTPWTSSAEFVLGLYAYFGTPSSVRNLTVRSWDAFNASATPDVAQLVGLDPGALQGAVWLTVTGGTAGPGGYQDIVANLVPLTAASRATTLVPFMLSNGLNVTRVYLYNLDYGPPEDSPGPPSPPPSAAAAAPAALPQGQGFLESPQGLAKYKLVAILVGAVALLLFCLLGWVMWRHGHCCWWKRPSRKIRSRESAALDLELGLRPSTSSFSGRGAVLNPLSAYRARGGFGAGAPASHTLPQRSSWASEGSPYSSARANPLATHLRRMERDLENWELDPAEIEVISRPDGSAWVLGEGASGVVYKASWRVQIVAVKMLFHSTPKQMEAFRREVLILEDLKDANIVQFLGACFEEDTGMLVTEFMAGGTLYEAIGHDAAGKLGWYQRGRKVAMDIARGLDKMHSRQVIHLDIKSANILLTSGGTAKIADVGLSRCLTKECTLMSNFQGTFEWAAPELINGGECSNMADVYSFGVVLWEIVTAERPYRKQYRKPRVPQECPQEISDLIFQCLSPDPRQRPSSTELFNALRQQAADSRPLGYITRGGVIAPYLTPTHSMEPPTGPLESPAQRSVSGSLPLADSDRPQEGYATPPGDGPSRDASTTEGTHPWPSGFNMPERPSRRGPLPELFPLSHAPPGTLSGPPPAAYPPQGAFSGPSAAPFDAAPHPPAAGGPRGAAAPASAAAAQPPGGLRPKRQSLPASVPRDPRGEGHRGREEEFHDASEHYQSLSSSPAASSAASLTEAARPPPARAGSQDFPHIPTRKGLPQELLRDIRARRLRKDAREDAQGEAASPPRAATGPTLRGENPLGTAGPPGAQAAPGAASPAEPPQPRASGASSFARSSGEGADVALTPSRRSRSLGMAGLDAAPLQGALGPLEAALPAQGWRSWRAPREPRA